MFNTKLGYKRNDYHFKKILEKNENIIWKVHIAHEMLCELT